MTPIRPRRPVWAQVYLSKREQPGTFYDATFYSQKKQSQMCHHRKPGLIFRLQGKKAGATRSLISRHTEKERGTHLCRFLLLYFLHIETICTPFPSPGKRAADKMLRFHPSIHFERGEEVYRAMKPCGVWFFFPFKYFYGISRLKEEWKKREEGSIKEKEKSYWWDPISIL